MTPLIVNSLLARKVRLGEVSAVALPLHQPTAEDRFSEAVRMDSGRIRLFFNNYQLGLNVKLAARVGFKENYALTPMVLYQSDLAEPFSGVVWYPAIGMPAAQIRDIYPVEKVSVERRHAFDFASVGCLQHEIQLLFPSLKDHPYCLLIHLKNTGGDHDAR